MKYDSQIVELKNLLPTAKSIFIALPTGSSIDKLAAGLALFLTLESSGKQVSIVCDDNIIVSVTCRRPANLKRVGIQFKTATKVSFFAIYCIL